MKLRTLFFWMAAHVAIAFMLLAGGNANASFPATSDPKVCTVAPCFTYRHDSLDYNYQPVTTGPQPSREVACSVWAVVQTSITYQSPYTQGYSLRNPILIGTRCEYDIYDGQGRFAAHIYAAGNSVATQTSVAPSAPSYSCPDPTTATLSGSICSCKDGYRENAAKNDCTPGGVGGTVVNVFNTSKPPPSVCRADLKVGKPISPLVGAETYTLETGLSLGGQPLVLTYDNRKVFTAASAGLTPMTLGNAPALGGLWESSLHRNIKFGTGGFGAQLFRGNGRVVNFNFNPQTNVFDATADVSDKLQVIPNGYRYSQVASRTFEEYNAAGQLILMADAAGNTLNFRYSLAAGSGAPAAGYLLEVTDNTGRSIKFEYILPSGGVAATDGLVSKIVDTTGRNITAAYTGGNLASITWQDGKTRQFLYENTSLTWALTGVMDENNARYATFAYDSQGRAISTEVGAGVNKFTASYGTPPQTAMTQTYDAATQITTRVHDWVAPSGVVLTLPNGQTSTVTSANVQGMAVLGGMSQPAGSGCAAASSAQNYDANGNLASTDDFNGQRSCYVYDGRGRETVRVEGLANTVACASVLPGGSTLPAGSRKIETSWYADWQLPVKVSEPLLRVTTVYHGQPDPFNGNAVATCTTAAALLNGQAMPLVCKQTVQGTADADGSLGFTAPLDTGVAPRSLSWTYNAVGQVLTNTDSTGGITGYSYYDDIYMPGNVPGEPGMASVGLLLHGDGINGATTIIDSSLSPKGVTAVGGAQISTTQGKFGGASVLLNGSSAYLSSPSHSDFNFGVGDFTIETWVRFNALPASGLNYPLAAKYTAAGNLRSWLFFLVNTSGIYELALGLLPDGTSATGVTSKSGSIVISTGSWYHLAVTRQGGAVRFFVNGQVYGPFQNATNPFPGSSAFTAGTTGDAAGGWLNGHLDDLRITKGLARYTTNFSPPVQAFPHSATAVVNLNATGHSIGDLKSITNAAGHVTQFTLYDAAGRVRQSVDPKGVVTDTAYTPRGWTSSVTVTPPGGTARTTNYTYDNAGQLTGAALPDGTTLGYSYDAAHRLTGVTDAKGNSVTYMLDNVGNKTGEQVKDPSGNLQRNITRVYDALNRVQQVTGASN